MKLRDYLAQDGITATALARDVGVSHTTIIRWADQSIQPSMDKLRRLNDVTNGKVTPNDFLEREGMPA